MAQADEQATPRASRRSRIRGRTARLRDRDLQILMTLARMRAVRTSDITRLFFQSKGTAQKRLRRLFDTGIIRPIVTDLAAETRFALTRLGHALLEQASDDSVPLFRPGPRVDGRGFKHHDLLVAFWTALALGTATHGIRLQAFRPEWELRSEDPHAPLVPDALLTLASNNNNNNTDSITLALECDTGAEAIRILTRKLERYDAIEAVGDELFGCRPNAVLFVTSTERRARRIARRFQNRPGVQVLVGAPPRILEDGGLSTGLADVQDRDVDETGPDFGLGLITALRA